MNRKEEGEERAVMVSLSPDYEMPRRESRGERTKRILAVTRALFDAQGTRDVQLEDVAKAVGINRAIIYRHFSCKEELFALTVAGYLSELDTALMESIDEATSPSEQLRAVAGAFLDYGQQYPAFVDCAQMLLRRRGEELMGEVREEVMLKLGMGMTRCMGHVVTVLEKGNADGEFDVPDPALLANLYYAQAFGMLNLTHLQLAVREKSPGMPMVEEVPFETARAYLIDAALSMARGPDSAVSHPRRRFPHHLSEGKP